MRAIVISLSALLLIFTIGVSLPLHLHQLRLRDRADGLRPRDARRQAGHVADRGNLAQDHGRSLAPGGLRRRLDLAAGVVSARLPEQGRTTAPTPARDAMDSPVVIVGDKNLSKVKPYLGDRYYEFPYRLIWWPRETYKGLTWQRIRDGIIGSSAARAVLGRGHQPALHDADPPSGTPSIAFSMFVRKDIAAQVWQWGAAPAAGGGAAAAATDPYASGPAARSRRSSKSASPAQPGNGPGQFNFPRAVTVDEAGQYLRGRLGEQPGRGLQPRRHLPAPVGHHLQAGYRGGLPGRRQGPVQRAVGHRGRQGRQRLRLRHVEPPHPEVHERRPVRQRCGASFGSTGGELGKPNLFYGPRTVAVGAGRQRLSDGHGQQAGAGVQTRRHVRARSAAAAAWSTAASTSRSAWRRMPTATGTSPTRGTSASRSSTPCSSTRRSGRSTAGRSQSVVNKPALAVDPERKLVYAVDPENYRVLALDTERPVQGDLGHVRQRCSSPSRCPPASRWVQTARSTWPTAMRTGS